ncbi:low density lipoprotein receptor adapter protein 1-B-like [Lucilia sericata]|uniref:low density lipoprotein receptor adapter protein 1-B-like n=1 Tax=Lucilia sericata TaxID=13632 RepID=UPI0018A863DE|nr:low density lipoprotein receptor adapter protein 1-B-like [Lucilia sericata]XP_037824451.1 low density lipoprotein receptor adapter protein 1-B-like [Lucilia sericata]XP_037824452.1 low density lipoprotein receptor adapter protein 1-B-like [Lucilia sericata]XP_037824453.1 low density lipoprotein receptor adapter protein 1-B-like [Lucilia sericata]XP_037824454.1 low density lipoprotein receptor adapter protein 1-B-like [Lucilia sericata]XP_037824455.1 low density lipoprotein receptor adapter
MAFFRKWKTHYKHKKFTSDDAIDGEDWGLDVKTPKDAKQTDDLKLNFEGSLEADDEEDIKPIFQTYDIKYLGCTPIDNKRSEKVTSEAIKTVIANAKAGGRKIKTQKRVKVNISQEGIEVLDHATDDSLMRFSIYKISYCSVDASNDHAFSFVSSEPDPLSDKEKLSCHVFLCPKRKIAHEITLLVARCFENAYQNWRDTVVHQVKQVNNNNSTNNNNNNIESSAKFEAKNILKEQNGFGFIESKAEIHYNTPDEQKKVDNPLIDLAATDNDVRKYLQNTWVSFEDDHEQGGHRMVAC